MSEPGEHLLVDLYDHAALTQREWWIASDQLKKAQRNLRLPATLLLENIFGRAAFSMILYSILEKHVLCK